VISDEALVRVVVRFAADVAARVAETSWHPTQEVDREPDGSLMWSARVAGLHEVRSWVLSWGGHAEVLEPAELRSWVRGEVDRASSRYR
jgi:predicted DNA-binding transcriptional regulator YafY